MIKNLHQEHKRPVNQAPSHHSCVSNGRIFILFTKWKPNVERTLTEHRAGTSHWKSRTTYIQSSLPDRYMYSHSLICTDNNCSLFYQHRTNMSLYCIPAPATTLEPWGHTAYIFQLCINFINFVGSFILLTNVVRNDGIQNIWTNRDRVCIIELCVVDCDFISSYNAIRGLRRLPRYLNLIQ